ncbi:hypothetical protein ACIA8K_29375 [Catenuloplanes sp. NPDC051500]|uniref:hypothetical protein n=1 Tax=Catenuloplanes sp. NPDC051500 TaxID=3363959 RepID=UPI0037A27FBD
MLALPVDPAVTEPFVDADDVAEAVVTALLGGGHQGRIYELTGSCLLTCAEAVASTGGGTFLSVPMAGFVAELRSAGEPGDAIALLGYLFGTLLDGRNACLGDGVQRLLGRPPRDLEATRTAHG